MLPALLEVGLSRLDQLVQRHERLRAPQKAEQIVAQLARVSSVRSRRGRGLRERGEVRALLEVGAVVDALTPLEIQVRLVQRMHVHVPALGLFASEAHLRRRLEHRGDQGRLGALGARRRRELAMVFAHRAQLVVESGEHGRHGALRAPLCHRGELLLARSIGVRVHRAELRAARLVRVQQRRHHLSVGNHASDSSRERVWHDQLRDANQEALALQPGRTWSRAI